MPLTDTSVRFVDDLHSKLSSSGLSSLTRAEHMSMARLFLSSQSRVWTHPSTNSSKISFGPLDSATCSSSATLEESATIVGVV